MMGIRSFPGTQGGVETHAENLCPLLVNLGCEVEVLARSTYHHSHLLEWKGVHFNRLYAPPFKRLETVVHSFISVMYAGLINRPDVLHIQAIGPALMTPLARLMGLKVVVTHHGPDYDRQKWGRFAKLTLQTGERLGMRWSNARIVISQVIKNIVLLNHDRDSHVIPNGVVLPEAPSSTAVLNKFGLNPFRYILLVSRLVPEKRHLDLIEAFNRAVLPGWKLAIVGSADHPGTYAQQVLDAAKQSPNIVCTGLQTGNALRELYGHAGMFVLPSSHEGLPIALLEALSYGLPVIASDIPANLEIGLAKEHYFPLGRTDVLTERLGEFSAQPRSKEACDQRRAWVSARYDWNDIAIRTLAVYKALAQ
jgi:glycosyltransferase involved in cell wall biosynthesis